MFSKRVVLPAANTTTRKSEMSLRKLVTRFADRLNKDLIFDFFFQIHKLQILGHPFPVAHVRFSTRTASGVSDSMRRVD